MIGLLGGRFAAAASRWRYQRHWRRLRAAGMRLGEDVYLPESTTIDPDFAALVEIRHGCSFGPECMLLPALGDLLPTIGVRRLGRITLEESCHIGARTVILPGVTVGPRTVVAANSVVSRSLPPETVCAGNPARVFSSLSQYLETHRDKIRRAMTFAYDDYDIDRLTPDRKLRLVAAVFEADAYMLGGRSAELERRGGSERTSTIHHRPQRPSP